MSREIILTEDKIIITLRNSFIKICYIENTLKSTATSAALLLDFFVSNHNKIASNDSGYKTRIDYLQDYSASKLYNSCFGLIGRTSIEKSIKLLVKLNLISIHKNPIIRYGFDNTRFYLLHDKMLAEKLAGISQEKVIFKKQENNTNSEKNLFKKVFERDMYRCKKCNSHLDLSVDHIFPASLGGDTIIDNLQTLCRSCNSKKGNKLIPAY